MRTEWKVAALSLALLSSACGKRPEPTASLPDDLKKDLAAASASASELAPQNYQRMRFVSDIERSRATTPASRPKVSRRHERMTASNHASGDPIASMASHTLETVATPAEAPATQPTIVVAAQPAPEPTVMQSGGPSDAGVSSDNGHGIGGILGGILGGVVIRGGHAGPDKCDPRTDGRARGAITGRPDFTMPIPIGQPIFGRSGRR